MYSVYIHCSVYTFCRTMRLFADPSPRRRLWRLVMEAGNVYIGMPVFYFNYSYRRAIAWETGGMGGGWGEDGGRMSGGEGWDDTYDVC